MRDHHVPLTPRHRPALVVESPLEKKFTFVVNIVKAVTAVIHAVTLSYMLSQLPYMLLPFNKAIHYNNRDSLVRNLFGIFAMQTWNLDR